MKNIFSITSLLILLTGCEKVIDLQYKSNQSTIVIEGNITNQPGPYFIKISKSVSLPETGNYPVIDNAVVTISDNAGNSETLAPQGNGMYSTVSLQGVAGRTYTLNVSAENKDYVAQSTMPQEVIFDSIQIEKFLFTGETEYNIIPAYNDPAAKGNFYRFTLTINNKLVNQHFVQNDEVKNGVRNTDKLEINEDDLELKQGDAVSVTMQCIDKKAALFYTTLQLMGDSGPGGGTTPNNPPTNISNGALGIFSAHTTATRSVILP